MICIIGSDRLLNVEEVVAYDNTRKKPDGTVALSHAACYRYVKGLKHVYTRLDAVDGIWDQNVIKTVVETDNWFHDIRVELIEHPALRVPWALATMAEKTPTWKAGRVLSTIRLYTNEWSYIWHAEPFEAQDVWDVLSQGFKYATIFLYHAPFTDGDFTSFAHLEHKVRKAILKRTFLEPPEKKSRLKWFGKGDNIQTLYTIPTTMR